MSQKNNILIESYYPEDEMTKYGFISHMEDFIKQLLSDPKTAKVDEYLLNHNIDNSKALSLLLKKVDPSDETSAILIRSERIKPDEEDVTENGIPKDKFHIKYKLPRKDYMKKMRNLYINTFESHIIEGCPINEMNANELPSKVTKKEKKDKITYSFGKNGCGLSDELIKIGKDVKKLSKDNNVYIDDVFVDSLDDVYDLTIATHKLNEEEGGGATSADASGAYVQPVFGKPIKRTIYITQKQADYLKEAVEMDTRFGDFGYDAPGLSINKDDPSMDHKNIFKKSKK